MQQPFRETENYMLLCTEDGPDSSCALLWEGGHEPKSVPVAARLVNAEEAGVLLIVLCTDEQIGVLDIDEPAIPLLLNHGVTVHYLENGEAAKVHIDVLDELNPAAA